MNAANDCESAGLPSAVTAGVAISKSNAGLVRPVNPEITVTGVVVVLCILTGAVSGTAGSTIISPPVPLVAVISHSPLSVILKPLAPGAIATGVAPRAIVVPCIVRGLEGTERLSNV